MNVSPRRDVIVALLVLIAGVLAVLACGPQKVAFSPDGKTLVYAAMAGKDDQAFIKGELVRVTVDDLSVRVLDAGPTSFLGPSFVDDEVVISARFTDPERRFFEWSEYRLDGSGKRILARAHIPWGEGHLPAPSAKPSEEVEARQLSTVLSGVFARGGSVFFNLFLNEVVYSGAIERESGAVRLLGPHDVVLDVSADGQQMLVARGGPKWQDVRKPKPRFEAGPIALTALPKSRMIKFGELPRDPSDFEHGSMAVLELASGEQREVRELGRTSAIGPACLLRDGRVILRDDKRVLVARTVADSDSVLLCDGIEVHLFAIAEATGQVFLAACRELTNRRAGRDASHPDRVFATTLQGGELQAVFDLAGFPQLWSIAVDPDGKRLALHLGSGGTLVAVVDLPDGGFRLVEHDPLRMAIGLLEWAERLDHADDATLAHYDRALARVRTLIAGLDEADRTIGRRLLEEVVVKAAEARGR